MRHPGWRGSVQPLIVGVVLGMVLAAASGNGVLARREEDRVFSVAQTFRFNDWIKAMYCDESGVFAVGLQPARANTPVESAYLAFVDSKGRVTRRYPYKRAVRVARLHGKSALVVATGASEDGRQLVLSTVTAKSQQRVLSIPAYSEILTTPDLSTVAVCGYPTWVSHEGSGPVTIILLDKMGTEVGRYDDLQADPDLVQAGLSPSGGRLAVASIRGDRASSGSTMQVTVFDRNGRRVQDVSLGRVVPTGLMWSADDARFIVFGRDYGAHGGQRSEGNVWLYNRDGERVASWEHLRHGFPAAAISRPSGRVMAVAAIDERECKVTTAETAEGKPKWTASVPAPPDGWVAGVDVTDAGDVIVGVTNRPTVTETGLQASPIEVTVLSGIGEKIWSGQVPGGLFGGAPYLAWVDGGHRALVRGLRTITILRRRTG